MATVNKNFRVKNGIIIEGSTATVGGNNVLVENGSDQYILDLIGGETLVKSVSGNLSVDNAGDLSIDQEGLFDTLVLDGLATETYVGSAITTAASNYDAAGAASTAESNANTYTDTQLGSYTPTSSLDATVGGYGYLKSSDLSTYATQTYADGAADDAETAANSYTDGRETAITSAYQSYADTAEQDAKNYADGLIQDSTSSSSLVWSSYKTSTEIGLAQAAAEDYTDTAVANVVGAAPELLDTLNELAAALQDNPDIISDLQDVAAGKQNTLTAGSNIDITGDTISVTGLDAADISDFNTAALSATSAAYDAAGAAAAAQTAAEGFATTAANNAQSAAEDYADGLASNYDAAGTAATAETNANSYADGLTNDMLDGTTPFTDININDVAKQIAARSTSLGSVTVTAYQFNKSAFKSGKFLVKIDNGTNNEISEILLTLDSSGNIAITEYAIVGTNGSRGTITADTDSTHCRIRVTPVDDSTITVSGTVFNS